MLYAVIVALVLVADQWLKYWVTVNITLSTGEMGLIPGVVKLVNIHNSGASFGMLGDLPFARWIFVGLSVAFVVLVIVLVAKKVVNSRFSAWCAIFAVAGAIGNCIDRVLYGYVVDMFKLEFMRFAVFNVADIVLVVSCILFLIAIFVGDKKQAKAEEEKPAKKSRKKPRETKSADGEETPSPRKLKIKSGPAVSVASADSSAFELFEKSDPDEELRIQEDDDFWNSLKYATGKGGRPSARPAAKPAEKPAPAAESSDEDLNASLDRIFGDSAKREPSRLVEKPDTLTGVSLKGESKDAEDFFGLGSLGAKPAEKADDEFDLDSILAEFKDL